MKSNHSVRKAASTPNPFANLVPAIANAILPVIQAIEAHLREQGLDPAHCRTTKKTGVEYKFSTEGGVVVSASIVCTPEILSEPFFVIRVHLGTLVPRLRNQSVLESLLFLNLARNQRCRTGLRADGSVQVLYSARVCEELDLFSLPVLFRETLDFAAFVRGTFVGDEAFLAGAPEEPGPKRDLLH